MEVGFLKKRFQRLKLQDRICLLRYFPQRVFTISNYNVNDLPNKKLYILVSLELYFNTPPSDILTMAIPGNFNSPLESTCKVTDLTSHTQVTCPQTSGHLIDLLFFIRLFCKPNSFEVLFAFIESPKSRQEKLQ